MGSDMNNWAKFQIGIKKWKVSTVNRRTIQKLRFSTSILFCFLPSSRKFCNLYIFPSIGARTILVGQCSRSLSPSPVLFLRARVKIFRIRTFARSLVLERVHETRKFLRSMKKWSVLCWLLIPLTQSTYRDNVLLIRVYNRHAMMLRYQFDLVDHVSPIMARV